MTSYGRFIFMHAINFSCARSCMVNIYRNVSKGALKSIKTSIFPLQPKKPLTAFLLYVKHVRPKFMEQEPHIKPSEILRKASKEWAEIDPTEKDHFQKQYREHYKIYTEELKKFKESITDEQKELWEAEKEKYKESRRQADKKKKTEAFGRPRKPPNAFLLYVLSKKDERNPDKSFKDFVRLLKESWYKLSATEKDPYIKKTMVQMEQYRKDLEEWEKKMINLGHADIVRYKTKRKYNPTKSDQ